MRNINLINYLPDVIKNIKEFKYITNVENIEIENLYKNNTRVLNNVFVYEADKIGIERYEKILNIKPREKDTKEERIFKIIEKINDKIPYTYMSLIDRLDIICGKNNYEIIEKFNIYELDIKVFLKQPNKIEELDYLLFYTIPANIKVTSKNEIKNEIIGNKYFGSIVVTYKNIEIKSKTKEEYIMKEEKNIFNIITKVIKKTIN